MIVVLMSYWTAFLIVRYRDYFQDMEWWRFTDRTIIKISDKVYSQVELVRVYNSNIGRHAYTRKTQYVCIE